jgi:hypothetical protein
MEWGGREEDGETQENVQGGSAKTGGREGDPSPPVPSSPLSSQL